jgi:hypothetical protein
MEEDVKMLRQVLDNLLAFLYRRNMRWYNSRISKEVLRLSIKHQITTGLKVAVQAC